MPAKLKVESKRTGDAYHDNLLNKLEERYKCGAFSDQGYQTMIDAIWVSFARMRTESPEMKYIRANWRTIRKMM